MSESKWNRFCLLIENCNGNKNLTIVEIFQANTI